MTLALRDLPPTDRIEAAVDYRDVATCVREVFASRQFQLVELLGAAIADELVVRFAATRALVRIGKPGVTLAAGGSPSVTVERSG